MVWRSVYNDLDRCLLYYAVELRFIAENNCMDHALVEKFMDELIKGKMIWIYQYRKNNFF